MCRNRAAIGPLVISICPIPAQVCHMIYVLFAWPYMCKFSIMNIWRQQWYSNPKLCILFSFVSIDSSFFILFHLFARWFCLFLARMIYHISGARLTKGHDVTIHRYREPHTKIKVSKLHILWCMGSNFMWNFKGALWNFTQNFEPIHHKICISQCVKSLTAYPRVMTS